MPNSRILLEVDGVEIDIHETQNGGVSLTVDKAEPVYLSKDSATMLALSLSFFTEKEDDNDD